MPEYSSTTITPADGVKTPAMNGSTSGNYTLSALRDFILASKGQANGLASLDANGKLPSSQLPDLADDVIVVASYASLPATGTAGKLYITADTNKMYRWDPDLTTPDYVELSVDLSAYATKAELAAEESARESEDSNLKSAIEGNSQRIENLEVAVSGSLVQTNTDATMANTKTITNANEILPWAILKRVGARAVSWNQQLRPFSQSGWWNSYNCTTTVDGYNATLNISGVNGNYSTNFKKINGHEYLIVFGYKVSRVLSYTVRFGNQYPSFTPASANTLYRYANKVTSNEDASSAIFATPFSGGSNNGDTISIYSPKIIDLTLMSMATGYTTDELANMFSGDYPANFGTLIPLNPSAFKVVGKNKIDPTTIVSGYYEDTNFELGSTLSTVYKSCKVWLNAGTYTLLCNIAINILRKVADGSLSQNVASGVTSYTFTTTTTGWVGLSFRDATSSSTDWSDSTTIQLEIGSSATAYEPYSEQTVLTPQIADGHYVNENCYDYVENVVENGVTKGKKHKTASDLIRFLPNNVTWNIEDHTEDGYILTYPTPTITEGLLPNHYAPTSQTELTMLCDKFQAVPRQGFTSSVGARVALQGIGYDVILFMFPTSMNVSTSADVNAYFTNNEVNFIYKLKTEVITDCVPIPNIPCEDGTTVTAVTPQTDLVNAIDVPNTIAYMTKISS